MTFTTRRVAAAAALAMTYPAAAVACSLCSTDLQRRTTLREEAALAKAVVVGTLENARLTAGGDGVTDLVIRKILKPDPAVRGKRSIVINRYQQSPDPYLVFCDVYKGEVDPYRGARVGSPSVIEYIKASMKLDPDDASARLLHAFKHLDAADPDVAFDAFLEFAKAADSEVAAVAPKLDVAKLRRMVADAPADRLRLLAYLLGACGGPAEADLLARMLGDESERVRSALDGLLGGYIELDPDQGFAAAAKILTDPNRPFPDKLAARGAVRFLQRAKPEAYRARILAVQELLLDDGDLADLAVEDLRRWGWWGLTTRVLAQYGKPSHAAPLVRHAIIRYALSCPGPEAAAFVARVRAEDPDTVKDLEEALRFEQGG